MLLKDYTLKITTKTWRKHSNSLYDYDNSNHNEQTFETTESGKLIRAHNDVYYFEFPNAHSLQNNKMDQSEEVLANIRYTADGIEVQKGNIEGQTLALTLGKGNNNNMAQIKQDDTIKLGRAFLKVIKVQTTKSLNAEKISFENTISEYFNKSKKTKQEPTETFTELDPQNDSEVVCKICLSGVLEAEDPLINPCKCAGSIGRVHVSCMRQWVSSKLETKKNKNVLTVFWKNLLCELCKADLPFKLNCNGKQINLLNLTGEISEPYIILQSFSKDNHCDGMHVMGLDVQNSFKIGRGVECDLRIQDISVSRIHADLLLDEDRVYIRDKHSRFGTLLTTYDDIKLNLEMLQSPWLQVGRTLIKFELKKPWLRLVPWLNNWLCLDRAVDVGFSKKEGKQRIEENTQEVDFDETQGQKSMYFQ